METTGSTSSLVSQLGGGSGVDMVKLAQDLAAARFLAQKGQLESRSEALEARISAASTLRSQITQLASALGDRIRNGDLAPTASLANPAVAQASVLPGATPGGSYTLEVTALASAQVVAGNAYGAATDLVGEGQLTFRFGTISGSGFSEDSGQAALVIDVGAADTLADLATRIRSAGAGLNAYVATTAEGPRLVVKGADGADKAFVIEAGGASMAAPGNPPEAGNIDYLAWHPASDGGRRKAAAADAAFLFDGVAMSSPTNKVSDLPGGLVLTLTGTNENAPTTISFADKSKQIATMMGDFVAALNDIAGSLRELADPKQGELGSDPGARALKRALSGLSTQVIMPGAAPGAPATLADLGLAVNRDGTFRLDSARLNRSLADDPAAVSAMFTTGLFGVYASVDSLARSVSTRGDPGTLGGSIERYTSQIERNGERLARIAEQQERLRDQLVKQFTVADRNVAASQSTLSFLKAQVAMWSARDR